MVPEPKNLLKNDYECKWLLCGPKVSSSYWTNFVLLFSQNMHLSPEHMHKK